MSGLFEERVPNQEIGNEESAFPIGRLGTRWLIRGIGNEEV